MKLITLNELSHISVVVNFEELVVPVVEGAAGVGTRVSEALTRIG